MARSTSNVWCRLRQAQTATPVLPHRKASDVVLIATHNAAHQVGFRVASYTSDKVLLVINHVECERICRSTIGTGELHRPIPPCWDVRFVL